MNVKTLKYFIATVAIISIVCSCIKNSLETPSTEAKSAITFSNVSTKATLDDIQKDGFGVWALLDNATVTDEVILNNAEVTYNSAMDSWEYSPLRYWIDESVFTFLAAYPYDESIYTLDKSNSSLNLSLSETPSQEDYLMATNMTDTSVEGYSRTVDLQFKHILTSVRLNIWRDNVKHNKDQIRIVKVTLGNIRKAGTYTSSNDLWTPSNERLTLEKTYEGGSDDDNIGGAIAQSDGSLITGGVPAEPFNEVMLIPQTIDASNRVALKVHYQLKRFDGEDKWEDVELEAELPYGTWEPNRRYTYNVVLSSVKDIVFYYIQTKISPWGAPQVGGTIIIK